MSEYGLDLKDGKNIEEFLNKNSLIEASAGTGKTYTIEELVKYLLVNKKAKPEEILVVTFTESAASEIKDRILARLKDSDIDGLEKMCISTIHGFCNLLLKEYYFELGIEQSLTLIDDRDIITESLYSYLRKDLFDDFRDCYKDVLEILGFSGLETQKNIDKIVRFIERIRYFLPLVKEDDNKPISKDEFCKLIKMIDNIKKNFEEWTSNRAKKTKAIEELENFLKNILKSNCSSYNLYLFSKIVEKVLENKNENFKELHEACLEFEKEYRDLLNLIVKTIGKKVIEKIDKYKRENNFITYDDMIHCVYKGIQKNEVLEIIQNRFRYGFIDEFQDTDPIQWEIFKKIFIENNENRLILIGDPKQSIYSFRHSDINTYFRAKDYIEKKGGYIASLDTNYRSIKAVIECYNKIFSKEYFNDPIEYKSVKSCPQKIEASFDCKGFYFFEIEDKKNKEKEFLDFILSEIREIRNGSRYKIKKNGETDFRSPSLSDIAILVSSRMDAEKIQSFLMKNGIGATIYKRGRLFQSEEAIKILYLIDYMNFPSDIKVLKRLVLSDFFYIEDRENFDIDEFVKTEQKVQEFIKTIREIYDGKREFNLYSIYKELETESNVRKKYTKIEAKRIIANYRHIIEILESIITSESLDLYGLRKRLIGMIFNSSDEDLYRMEDDEDKVRILTIHASKGLEFPIVFDYAALKALPNNQEEDVVIDKKNNQEEDVVIKVYFKMGDDEKKKVKEMKYDEYKRLHYVAITRAMVSFYLPVIKKDSEASSKGSKANSNKSLAESLDYDKEQKIGKSIKENNKKNNNNNNKENNNNIKIIDDKLKKSIKERSSLLYSFTTIHREKEFDIFTYLEHIINDETADEPEDDDGLPSGKEGGLFFHYLLEKIDYTQEIDESFVRKLASYYFDKTKLDEISNKTVELIKRVMGKKLDPLGISFKDITRENRMNEVEFYLPIENSFIKGYIDLVFRHDDKYYIVDWKSNRVLSDCRKHFEENYKLQSDIYTYSFVKYLEKSVKDFEYSKHFGGTFFIYIKRIDEDGVVYLEPKNLEDYRKRIEKEIGSLKWR